MVGQRNGTSQVRQRPHNPSCGQCYARSLKLAGALILFLLAAVSRADTHVEVVDLFASMAAGLSEDNSEAFLSGFEKTMPEFEKLKVDVPALLSQAELTSSVSLLKDEGDDTKRKVDLDWFLEIRVKTADGPVMRRREVIHCTVEKRGKKWRVMSLRPVEFFAAVKF